jgi:hypothetical protein
MFGGRTGSDVTATQLQERSRTTIQIETDCRICSPLASIDVRDLSIKARQHR